MILADNRAQARRRLREIEAFLAERLQLRLNPRRCVIAPLSAPLDFLGYVHHTAGRTRVRRRSVRRLRRRVAALDQRLADGSVDRLSVRSSLASWVGLAGYADAFRLSRSIFSERDVRNIGKRLLVAGLGEPQPAPPTRRAGLDAEGAPPSTSAFAGSGQDASPGRESRRRPPATAQVKASPPTSTLGP